MADRRQVEARFDALVRENRFTIAVVFPLVGTALLVASAEGWVGEPWRFNPALVLAGTFVMRAPLLAGIAPLVGRREAAGLVALTAYTYAVEIVGVTTGFPYGEFTYGVSLGPMIGGVPAALPVFFFPLVLNSYLLVLLLDGGRSTRLVRALAAVAVVVGVDLVLDPGAVALGFWRYGAGGAYYGVPISNYAGWLLSAGVAVAIVEATFDAHAVRERLGACEFALDDLVSFVLLWGTVNVAYGNWTAVAVAGAFLAALIRANRFDFRVARPA
ncbi:MAG: bisanhydrobacterioruberin hydratase [Halobacteriaceae archaeon]